MSAIREAMFESRWAARSCPGEREASRGQISNDQSAAVYPTVRSGQNDGIPESGPVALSALSLFNTWGFRNSCPRRSPPPRQPGLLVGILRYDAVIRAGPCQFLQFYEQLHYS